MRNLNQRAHFRFDEDEEVKVIGQNVNGHYLITIGDMTGEGSITFSGKPEVLLELFGRLTVAVYQLDSEDRATMMQ